jgi:poly(hydroxyalkanoate) granule-associated protein
MPASQICCTFSISAPCAVAEGFKLLTRSRSNAEEMIREAFESAQESVQARLGSARDQASETWDNLEALFQSRVHKAMNQLGVPTAEEIRVLTRRVAELLELRVERGARLAARRRRGAGRRRGQRLRGAHREPFLQDPLAQCAAAFGVAHLEQRLRVTHAEAAVLDVALHLLRQLEQAQVVRDRGAIEPDAPADLLLGGAGVGERAEGDRELDRVEIAALHVLDQRDLEAIVRIDLGDHGRDRVESRALRGAPAPLADDELVAIAGAPHDHRLEHAVDPDRAGEPLEVLFGEDAPRLVRVRVDRRDRQRGVGAGCERRRSRCGLGSARRPSRTLSPKASSF